MEAMIHQRLIQRENVFGTGTFTIPLMKRIGYKPTFAGAVEAAASTGGQIMPPVMGSAAFIVSDFTGIPYLNICLAALVPALLYSFVSMSSSTWKRSKPGSMGYPRRKFRRSEKPCGGAFTSVFRSS